MEKLNAFDDLINNLTDMRAKVNNETTLAHIDIIWNYTAILEKLCNERPDVLNKTELAKCQEIPLNITIPEQIDNGDNETILAVDKLINDTKQEVAQENQYKTELINRIQNSTCLSVIYDPILKANVGLGNTTVELEQLIKVCVAQGLIK